MIGKNALIDQKTEGMAFGAFMTVYRSKHNSFFYQLFDTDIYYRRIHQNLGATINSINGKDFKKFLMPFPPLAEQLKITEILAAWDIAINIVQKLVESLQQQKKALNQQLMTGKLRVNGFHGKWEPKRLSFYLKLSKLKNFDLKFGKEDVLSVSGEYGIVNQIEFQGRSFAGKSVANYGLVEEGDVVYTKSPLKLNPYGIIKLNKGSSGIVSTLYAVYKCKSTVNGEYLDYYFELNDHVNSYLRPLVQKGTKNDMKINNEKVLIDEVNFPSLIEQNAIVKVLKSADKEIVYQKAYLNQLKTQKTGLLQQLLTGEKRVKIN